MARSKKARAKARKKAEKHARKKAAKKARKRAEKAEKRALKKARKKAQKGSKGAKGSKKTVARLPKKKCCVSKNKCKRCPLRMLKEGTLPEGYTVKRRKLVKVEKPKTGKLAA